MTRPAHIALITLAFLAVEIALIFCVDQPLSDYMRSMDAYHPAWIDAFRAFTDLGKSKWYLWPTGLSVIFCSALTHFASMEDAVRLRLRKIGEKLFFAFVAIAASGIITDIIKPILGRSRPVMLMHEDIYGFQPFTFHTQWNSLPSGHATTAITLGCILSLYFPRGRYVWFALGIVMCLSRVAVNAHFLSDIIAGGLIGCLTVAQLRKNWGRGMFHVERWLFPIDRPVRPR